MTFVSLTLRIKGLSSDTKDGQFWFVESEDVSYQNEQEILHDYITMI